MATAQTWFERVEEVAAGGSPFAPSTPGAERLVHLWCIEAILAKRNWAPIIAKVLQASDRPLTAVEIGQRAVREGWFDPDTPFPSDSIKTAIRIHRREGNAAGFVVIPDTPHQRYWLISKRGW